MRICIPMKTAAEGGGNYVINNFRLYLDGKGIEHIQDLGQSYDVLFTNSWNQDYYSLLEGLRHNIDARIVHRADGVAWAYGRRDNADQLHKRIAHLADAVIYQSQYCYETQRFEYQLIEQDGPVIWNPANLEQFQPDGPKVDLQGDVRVAYAKFSMNPYKGEAQLYAVAEANPDIDFYLCGRYADPPDLPNLHLMGLLDRENLSNTLRSCHILLAFFRNEPCSNVIIEAMASGLPVLHLDSGSNTELVQEAGYPVTVETFREKVNIVMADYDRHSQKARARAEQSFSMGAVFDQYLTVIEQVLASPPRLAIEKRKRLIAMGKVQQPIEALWRETEQFWRRVRRKLRLMFGGRKHR